MVMICTNNGITMLTNCNLAINVGPNSNILSNTESFGITKEGVNKKITLNINL